MNIKHAFLLKLNIKYAFLFKLTIVLSVFGILVGKLRLSLCVHFVFCSSYKGVNWTCCFDCIFKGSVSIKPQGVQLSNNVLLEYALNIVVHCQKQQSAHLIHNCINIFYCFCSAFPISFSLLSTKTIVCFSQLRVRKRSVYYWEVLYFVPVVSEFLLFTNPQKSWLCWHRNTFITLGSIRLSFHTFYSA